VDPFIVRIAAYPLLKYLAYAGWCGLVAPSEPKGFWFSRWGLGLIRLGIGIVIGTVLTFFGLHLQFARSALATWAVLMLFIRWFEWSLITLLLKRPSAWAWKLGGIAVSFATDGLAVCAAGAIRGMIC
jgi:hypothetical protein